MAKKGFFFGFILSFLVYSKSAQLQPHVTDIEFEKVVMETMQPHTQLSPFFQNDGQMYPVYREKTKILGEMYFKKLADALPGVKLIDTLFIGSLASYSYTSHSDIDINILVDTHGVEGDPELIRRYLALMNRFWHTTPISMFKYSAQVTVVESFNQSGGIYSVLQNKWIKKPTHDKITFLKKDLVRDVNHYRYKFSTLQKNYYNNPKQFDCEKFRQFYLELKDWRTAGVKQSGLTSLGNIGFRVIRNLGELDVIDSLYLQCEQNKINGNDARSAPPTLQSQS